MPITTTGAGTVAGGGGPVTPTNRYFNSSYFGPNYFAVRYFP